MRSVATLRFFYCGRGDTILLEFVAARHGSRDWALVDCNLTKSSGAYWRVRECLRKYGVKDLKFACLSHPDLDHFFGMRELLKEHFHTDDGDFAVKEFWDSGVDYGLLSAVAERAGLSHLSKKLDSLYGFLVPLIDDDRVEYDSISQHWGPVDGFGDFRIKALSPRGNRVRRFNRQEAARILKASEDEFVHHVEEKNGLSVILVLMHTELPVNVLLGADAPAEVWEEALSIWDEYLKQEKGQARRFAAVKVSHHGARGSLCNRLYEKRCWKNKSIAILSVGPNDPEHPHPDVLGVLKARGIRTYATCRPGDGPARRLRGCPIPGRKAGGGPLPMHALDGYKWADVELHVLNNGKLKVDPPESLLRLA